MIRGTVIGLCLAFSTLWFGLVEAIAVPACQNSSAPQQTALKNVRTTSFNVTQHPFGLGFALHKPYAFVALNTTLGVLNTTTFPPHLIHEIPLPKDFVDAEGALGLTLTPDGLHIVVAAGPGAIIVDTGRAMTASPNAVVGTLQHSATGDSSIQVTITEDDQYALVSQEYGTNQTNHRGNIQVYHLNKEATNGSVSGDFVGALNLDFEVVGTALSPDGRTLYATSESMVAGKESEGILSTIDLATLKTNPAQALLSSTPSGCSPVRIIVSSDGNNVWVTARGSNRLLSFDAAKLRSNATNPLQASVEVGTSPVGLIFVQNETRILTADSNRFSLPGATTGLSVVNVSAALKGETNAVLGRIPTGLFPRELVLSPDNKTVLVSDFTSKQIQALEVTTLP